ncbi:unnamed protein product, partial [Owenia fusiformis]
ISAMEVTAGKFGPEKLLIIFLYAGLLLPGVQCLLYPRESESREMKDLNGMWDFRIDSSASRREGLDRKWFSSKLSHTGPVMSMPVPSSYNDITVDKSIRDFVGWAWYDREFFVSADWQNKRIMMRFDSAHYFSMVWINGQELVSHNGGHLPFEAEVNKLVNFNEVNYVTIAINNTLTPTTLPPGTIQYKTDTKRYPPGYFVQNLQMDFFNYAGIHRSVRLYTTPKSYLSDVTITTNFSGTEGLVNYALKVNGTQSPSATYRVVVIDKAGKEYGPAVKPSDIIHIQNVHLWWPYTMNSEDPAYMYTLKITVTTADGTDVYRQPFGVRTVKTTNSTFLINNKAFYCHGAAKHEDSDIRGKGLDFPLIARDFVMMKWLGINCFRTSHYPYAEEILDQADQQGIVVIDESPGVGIKFPDNMGNISVAHHMEVMGEMYARDKNRPAVVMWSVANEPASSLPEADHYFKSVIGHIRQLDPTRPVTFVSGGGGWNTDRAAQYVDVLCINHYYGWYSDTGVTGVIQRQLTEDLTNWNKRFNKPVIITEYGADTIAGLHRVPSFIFTEEYQVDFMREYHAVFDKLRTQFFVGEMVWNFADFMTIEQITRVVGNKKGLLNRQREPKMAAHFIRDRYLSLANGLDPASCNKNGWKWLP